MFFQPPKILVISRTGLQWDTFQESRFAAYQRLPFSRAPMKSSPTGHAGAKSARKSAGEILDAKTALARLEQKGDATRAKAVVRFFKTGKGEYGEGDVFLGVSVPEVRSLVRIATLPLSEIEKLVRNRLHEARMLGLLSMVRDYARGDEEARKAIFESYTAHARFINNWDLVDCSAEYVVGPTLQSWSKGERRKWLDRFVRSDLLWERRIAVLATFHFIKEGESAETLRIAEALLEDRHDLIQKAVGWMLREVGKRVARVDLEKFLDTHASSMPRTMLRYAIEHFTPERRARYLAMRE